MNKIARSALLCCLLLLSFVVGVALMPVAIATGWIMGWIGLHIAFSHYIGYRFAMKDAMEKLEEVEEE